MKASQSYLSALAALSIPVLSSWGQDVPETGPDLVIHYPDTPLRLIFSDYEQQSGRKIITDGPVPDREVFIQTVQTLDSKKEWINLVERALGFYGVRFGPIEGNSVRVTFAEDDHTSGMVNYTEDEGSVPEDAYRYALWTPKDYDSSRPYPVVIYLHEGDARAHPDWTRWNMITFCMPSHDVTLTARWAE